MSAEARGEIMSGHNLSQMQLVADIGKLLTDKYGVQEVEARHWNAIVEAANTLCAEFNRASVMATAGMGLDAWMGSDDTGLSSMTMARTLAPYAGLRCPAHRYDTVGNPHPQDASDFGRCVRLLEAVPELRPWLAKMSACGPAWDRFVGYWDELEALYWAKKFERVNALITLRVKP